MMWLPYGEEIMILGRTMWTQCTSVTDGRTDGQADRRTEYITITKTVQRRAPHVKSKLSSISSLNINQFSQFFSAIDSVRNLLLTGMHNTPTMSLHYLVKHKYPKTNNIVKFRYTVFYSADEQIDRQAGRRLDSAPSANVVAMATRVSPTRFCMVALNRPSPKIP